MEIAEVYREYSSMVYRLAFVRTKSRADADDILQDVFLRFLRFAPTFKSEEHRKAWLIRATINCSNSFLSSAWFRHTVALDDSLPAEDDVPGELCTAVFSLSPKYRTVIHLYYYEDYSVREIAELTGQNENTVRTRLSRARTLLREMLKGEFEHVSAEL